MLTALIGALVLGSACGGDGGGTGPNTAPVANFTAPSCTAGTACTFTDASTDNVAVTGWDWDFGDGTTPHATTANAAHTYGASGTFNVKLTVTDGAGLTGEKTVPVTVAEGALTAGFTYNCNAGNCTFTNTSIGNVASYAWDFGEPASGANNQSILKDPTHSYTIAGPTDFTVMLTVTDAGGATDVETQTVRVTQDLVCTGGDCTIVLSQKSTVTITVAASDCEFIGNSFAITEPIQEQVFTNGCQLADGTAFNINGGAAFNAGTNLQAQFTQGTKPRPGDPDPGPAATRVSGAFPDWTIEFDDGGNVGAPGEPDFNDIVLTVHATVVP
jgi:PKD repeat protein